MSWPERFYRCVEHKVFYPQGMFCPACDAMPQPPVAKDTRDGDKPGRRITPGRLARLASAPPPLPCIEPLEPWPRGPENELVKKGGATKEKERPEERPKRIRLTVEWVGACSELDWSAVLHGVITQADSSGRTRVVSIECLTNQGRTGPGRAEKPWWTRLFVRYVP